MGVGLDVVHVCFVGGWVCWLWGFGCGFACCGFSWLFFSFLFLFLNLKKKKTFFARPLGRAYRWLCHRSVSVCVCLSAISRLGN